MLKLKLLLITANQVFSAFFIVVRDFFRIQPPAEKVVDVFFGVDEGDVDGLNVFHPINFHIMRFWLHILGVSEDLC